METRGSYEGNSTTGRLHKQRPCHWKTVAFQTSVNIFNILQASTAATQARALHFGLWFAVSSWTSCPFASKNRVDVNSHGFVGLDVLPWRIWHSHGDMVALLLHRLSALAKSCGAIHFRPSSKDTSTDPSGILPSTNSRATCMTSPSP